MEKTAWLLCSIALGLLAWVLAASRARSLWQAVLWSAGAGLFGLVTLLFAVAHHLTAHGIDQSVIFHLKVGLTGAGLGDYLGLMVASVLGLLLTVAGVVWMCRRLLVPPMDPRVRPWAAKPWTALALPLALAAWATHPAVRDAAALVRLQVHSGVAQQPSEHHRLPSALVLSQPRNLVLIYLESLERGFLDERRFPGLTPNLHRLRSQAIDFSQIGQPNGTGWTIAGMVASQCGVPLLTLLQGNDMAGTDSFMSEATCLGDLLKAQGYRMHYMGGARLDFAGKGRFYTSHGFESVEGLTSLREQLADPKRVSTWGLYDDDLLSLAWQRHQALAKSGDPFGLVLLTLDTHPPDGHVSPTCEQHRYRDGRNPMLNAVHCSDRLVGALVDRIRSHPSSKNTVIWIASDHLAMPNAAWSLLEQGPRRNLLMALVPDQPTRVVDKPGSMLDAGASVLDSLGANEPVLAYGRSLLADVPTLVQASGDVDGANRQLAREVGFLAGLWKHPQVNAGLRLLDDRRVALGSRTVRFPVLMLVDDKLEVTRLSFGDALPSIIGDLHPAQRFVWLDSCERVHGLVVGPAARSPRQPDRLHCLAVGAMGSSGWQVFTPLPGEALSFAQLRRAVGVLQDAPGEIAHRRARVDNWTQHGSFDIKRYRGAPGSKGQATIQVAGGPAVAPMVRLDGAGASLPLERGITVLGFDGEGKPHKLAYRDTCGDDLGQALENDAPLLDSLSAAVPAHQLPGGVAVVVQDSGVCGGDSLASLEGLEPFPVLRALGMREPYVAYIERSGQVHEYSGPPESALALRLENFVRGKER